MFDNSFFRQATWVVMFIFSSLALVACGGGDGGGKSSVSLKVSDLTLSTEEDIPLSITLSASGTAAAKALFALVTDPSHGQIGCSGDTNAICTYTPNADFNGSDSFTYQAENNGSATEPATVTITVTPVEDAPRADNVTATTDEDADASVTLAGVDPDGTAVTYNSPSAGDQGGALNCTDADCTYTPLADFFGTEIFTYTVTSDGLSSLTATVTITVTPVEDAPRADNVTAGANEDTTASVTLAGADPDGTAVTYNSPSAGDQGGALSCTGADCTYTPLANFSGTEIFTYTVTSGGETSPAATVTITVNGVNDAPTISGAPITTGATGTAYSFTPTASDVDGDNLSFSLTGAPGWLSINASSGELSGTPTDADIPASGDGVFADVDICVTDNVIASPVCLGVFTITVTDESSDPVTSLAAWDEDNAVDLSWANPGSADLAGVVIMRRNDEIFPTGVNDAQAVQVSDTLLEGTMDAGLTAGTYHYAAFAYDEVPNYSPAVTATATPFDPFTRQRANFHASDASSNDRFGWSVSISGDYALVGATQESGGAGNPISWAGAAYVFKRDPGTGNWSQTQKLMASDAQADDWFGWSVSISGDYAIVGAYAEDGGTGDPVSGAGAAYVFQRDPGTDNWNEVAILHASDAQADDSFGHSVSISGDYAIVGAVNEDGGTGDPLTWAGAAYVFKRDPGTGNWSQTHKLTASDPQAYDWFSYSVAISGDYAMVGAHQEDGGAGNPINGAGAAYVFKRDTGTGNWSQTQKLMSIDAQASDQFGVSVSISGDYAIFGASLEDGGSGDPINGAGAAYVFKRDTGTGNWSQTHKLMASDSQLSDNFGSKVSISGDNAIVGASYEDGG
ncbi:MAG: Ig-like domain-containing protein, partial [Deltaproteobacteria bacterium]|nr:Ig-like domain-containing protein [Deltaproteobacteria bacterium]